MATRRTDILDALVTHLANNTTALVNNIDKQYHVLDEVNDFPAITFLPQGEVRTHRGDGRKLATLTMLVRAYAHDGDGSEIIGVTEELAESIEDAITTFADSNRALGLEESDVVSFRTDEGLFAPYGIADLEAIIVYEVNV